MIHHLYGDDFPRFAATRGWMDDAECAKKEHADIDFFPSQRNGGLAEPKAVCAKCPVKEACLDYAIRFNEQYGVWGGTSEHERRRLRRAWLDRMRRGRGAA